MAGGGGGGGGEGEGLLNLLSVHVQVDCFDWTAK